MYCIKHAILSDRNRSIVACRSVKNLTRMTELGLHSGALKESLEELVMARRKAPDPKLDTLRKHSSLHQTPEKVRDTLFASNQFFDPRDLV